MVLDISVTHAILTPMKHIIQEAKKENKKILIAKTFTPIYDELEDRIRLIVNYQDMPNRVDFMITRNFVIKLIPSIDDYIFKYYDDIAITEQTVSSSANTNTKSNNISKTDKTDLSFLHTGDKLLTSINLSYHPNSKKTTIKFYSKDVEAKATLDSYNFQQIIKIIKKTIPNFKWGIAPNF